MGLRIRFVEISYVPQTVRVHIDRNDRTLPKEEGPNKSPPHLYLAIICSTTTLETSIFVRVVKPSSNMSSVSRELPQPTMRMLSSLRTYCDIQSLSPE